MRSGRAVRLAGWNYASPGAYFITVCAHDRQILFADNQVAQVIRETWLAIPHHFDSVAVDAFVVMPNHIHGLLIFNHAESFGPTTSVGPRHAGDLQKNQDRPPASLSTVVRSFKSATTRELRVRGYFANSQVWQRNYFDRVVRHEAEFNRIREYIALNPTRWHVDHDNPHHVQDDAYAADWSWLEDP